MIERKQREFDELQNTLRDAISEGNQLDALIDDRDSIIAELEAQLKKIAGQNRATANGEGGAAPMKNPVPQKFIPAAGDNLDELFSQHMKALQCEVPIKKLGGGYYVFGTKRVYAKVMNGKLVIRVGGGYMVCLLYTSPSPRDQA